MLIESRFYVLLPISSICTTCFSCASHKVNLRLVIGIGHDALLGGLVIVDTHHSMIIARQLAAAPAQHASAVMWCVST